MKIGKLGTNQLTDTERRLVNQQEMIQTIDALCSYVVRSLKKTRKRVKNGERDHIMNLATERGDYILDYAHRLKTHILMNAIPLRQQPDTNMTALDDLHRAEAAARKAILCNQYGEDVPVWILNDLLAAIDAQADDTLADTQRAIIEAAERRGYERGLKEAQAEAVQGAWTDPGVMTDREVLTDFVRVCRENKPVGQWPGERVCVAIERTMAREAPFQFISEADRSPEREPSNKNSDRPFSGPRKPAQPASVAVPADVARDAARYRWLRNDSGNAFDDPVIQGKYIGSPRADWLTGKHADEAIDLAMLAAAKGGGA